MVEVFPDAGAVAEAAALMVAERAEQAVAARGHFSIALSGGSTPRALFELLAKAPYRERLPWQGMHFFWGDERTVGPDHPDSNFRMTRETLLDPLGLGESQVHRIRGELPPEAAAQHYEDGLRGFFVGEPWPRFDLVLLGMGDDGHTASLFPHTRALDVQDRWVVANEVPQLKTWRITLTVPALNAARELCFLVTGQGKAARLAEVLKGPRDPERLPAQHIAPTNGTLRWLIDAAAAAALG